MKEINILEAIQMPQLMNDDVRFQVQCEVETEVKKRG